MMELHAVEHFFGTAEEDAALLARYADRSKTYTVTPTTFRDGHHHDDHHFYAYAPPSSPNLLDGSSLPSRAPLSFMARYFVKRWYLPLVVKFHRLRVETGLTTLELWEQWVALTVFAIVLWQLASWCVVSQGGKLVSAETLRQWWTLSIANVIPNSWKWMLYSGEGEPTMGGVPSWNNHSGPLIDENSSFEPLL